MRKEIVEKIYLKFEELSEHKQHQEIKEARNNVWLKQRYFEYEFDGYQLNIDDLKERYNVDFEIEFFEERNNTDIKGVNFKNKDDLLHLNYDEFYDELLAIVYSYEFLFKNELDDNFDVWVRDYFIDTDTEFLISQRVIEDNDNY